MHELERTEQLYGATEEQASEKFAELRIAAENTANKQTDLKSFSPWARMAIKAVWPLLVSFVNVLPIDEETRTILKANLDYIYKKLVAPNVEPVLATVDTIPVEEHNKQMHEKDLRIAELTNSLLTERKGKPTEKKTAKTEKEAVKSDDEDEPQEHKTSKTRKHG